MRIFFYVSLLLINTITGCKPPAGKSVTSEASIDKARMFCKEQLNKEFDINTYLYSYPPQNNEYPYCVETIDPLEQAQAYDLLKQAVKFCDDKTNQTLDYKLWAKDMKYSQDQAKKDGKVMSPPNINDTYCLPCVEEGEGKDERPCFKASAIGTPSTTTPKPKQ